MNSFFTKKYIKVPVVTLVIVSLLLQFVPQPAQAFNPADILKSIISKIQIPKELELTSEGSIKFGDNPNYLSSFDCLFKQQPEPSGNSIDLKFCGCKVVNEGVLDFDLKCGWRDNGSCCSNASECGGKNNPCCVDEFNEEECVNPFSTFRFGHYESQVPLKTPEGGLTVPQPKIPLKCQLKIPLPGEDDTMDAEEKLAERRACNYFRRVQQSAAQIAYTAKKIFNNTDPLSECFFLRNCKTSCSLRFGSVGYTITLLDVIRLFVGDVTVVLNVVQKIVNVVKIFRQLLDIAVKFKKLLDQGSGVINKLFESVKNIYTLGSSLQNLGFKISDALVGSFAVDAIKNGPGEMRVTKGYNGFVALISNFASNLEKYQNAKGEAFNLVGATKKDAFYVLEEKNEDVGVEGFKNEPEIGFLFVKKNAEDSKENYRKKIKMDDIIANFQTMFQPISTLINRVALIGEDFDGQSFSLLPQGTREEWWEKSVALLDNDLCDPETGAWNDRNMCDETHSAYDTYRNYGSIATREQFLEDVETYMLGDSIEIHTFLDGQLITHGIFSSKDVSNTTGLTTGDVVFDEEFFNDFCTEKDCWNGNSCNVFTFIGDRVTPTMASYKIPIGAIMLSPEYIRGMLEDALKESNKFNRKDNNVWGGYWENLAVLAKGQDWVDDRIFKGRNPDAYLEEMESRHRVFMALFVNEDPGGLFVPLKWIATLDQHYGYSSCGKSNITSECIEAQMIIYENEISDRPNLRVDNGEGPWFDTFQDVFRGVSDMKAIFVMTSPNYIKNVVAESLKAYGGPTGSCTIDANGYKIFCSEVSMVKLNLTRPKPEWLRYWEDLGNAVLGKDATNQIMKDNDDKESVHELQERIIKRYEFLSIITDLEGVNFQREEDTDNVNRRGFNNPSFKKIFEGGSTIDSVTEEVVEVIGYNKLFEESFEVRNSELAKIEVIKENIGKLLQQDEELRGKLKDSEIATSSAYWESRMWCNSDGNIHPEDQYVGSYDGSVALGNDWQRRIQLARDSVPDLDVIKGALSYSLGPNQPLLVYYIDKARDKLTEYSEIFENVIDDVLIKLKEDEEAYCKEEDDVCSEPVANQGEYVEYCEHMAAYEINLNVYKCYKNGSGNNCSNVPITPRCDSWIGSCNTCEQCGDNAYDNAKGTCEKVTGDVWYECDDRGYYSTRTRCENACGDGDCDREREYDYKCHLSGHDDNHDEFGSRSSCTRNCRWSSCSSDSRCEDAVCSANNEACELEDRYKAVYEREKRNADIELARLKPECLRRQTHFDYINNSDKFKIDFQEIIKDFEDNFEDIEEIVEELQYLWGKRVDVQRESAVASSTIHKVLRSIELSESVNVIIKKIEDDLLKLDVIDDIETHLNNGYSCNAGVNCIIGVYRCKEGFYNSDTCEKVSNKTWNRFLLVDEDDPDRSGIIIKLRIEIEDARKQVLEFIKSRTGENISYNTEICLEDKDELGFLGRVSCFEDKEIDRDFRQLPNFIKVIEGFENVMIALDKVKDNIMELEPRLDLERAQSDKSLMEKIKENPITILEEYFNNITDFLDDIKKALNSSRTRIDNNNVFGKPEDAERAHIYKKAINNLRNENIVNLEGLIFMRDDITKGCSVLSPVLNSNPEDTRQSCTEFYLKEDTEQWLIGTDIDDFNNLSHLQGCRDLERIDLRLFDEGNEKSLEEKTARKGQLENQLKNIKKVECDDPTEDKNISCPLRFCIDPATGKHGVGAMGKDPYCKELCDNWTEGQNTGYVCDFDNNIVWDATVEIESGWDAWPPSSPCLEDTGYIKGHQAAKAECINLRGQLDYYEGILGSADDNEFGWVTTGLIAQCDELDAQRSLKRECEHFEMLDENVFEDNCNRLRKCTEPELNDVYKGLNVPPCREYCKYITRRAWGSFCQVSNEARAKGLEPVLTSCTGDIEDGVLPNLTLAENNEQRFAVIEKCESAAYNIEKPLDEIMKIFSILLGIKSATGLYSGIQVLKSSTQKIIADVTDFVELIKGTVCADGSDCNCGTCEGGGECTPGVISELQCLWNSEGDIDLSVQGGFSIDPLMCESHPAVSYAKSKDAKLTSNKGGPVCRGVGDLFQQIEGQFALVRQNTQNIDLASKGVKEGGIELGRLKLNLWKQYVSIYDSFDDLKDRADDIKLASSYVWALANAVNFANEQCSCGESYCKFPLCVSGLPLAFAPVKNPYCYMVWIFRYPMEKVAERLEELLEQQIQ